MSQPTVTLLSTTPVKGFALHHPDSIELTAAGAAGDRLFFLVDDKNKLFSITRHGGFAQWMAELDPEAGGIAFAGPAGERLEGDATSGKPLVADFFGDHGVTGYVVDGPWANAFSELAGQPVRLVRAKNPGEGVDVHPVTLMADASAAALGDHGGVEVDVRRFRMTIGFGGAAAHAEESWRGQTVHIGSAAIRVGGPVPRCNAVTRDPDTGVSDQRTLHLISTYRGRQSNEFGDGLNLGAYATVVTPGRVSVGDALQLG